MTLEELREACAMVAEDWPATEADRKALGDRVRAIPLPAPVDDEFAGHTPGPWEADVDGSAEVGVWAHAGSCLIATIHGDEFNSDETNANARLVAAAPRLLRERNEAREELARVTKERDEARYLLSALHACMSDGHSHTALRAEYSCTAEALNKLCAEVAGLTAALAAAQRERDKARAQLQSTFQQWTRAPK